MQLTKLNSHQKVNVQIRKYKVDWDKKKGSDFQFAVKSFFKRYWSLHLCAEELLIPGSLLRCDLVNFNKMLIVEANGIQHDEYNAHFHAGNPENFRRQIFRDIAKRDWAERNGFQLLEVYEKDLPLTRAFFEEKYGVKI